VEDDGRIARRVLLRARQPVDDPTSRTMYRRYDRRYQ
jgi:hypothetical protein